MEERRQDYLNWGRDWQQLNERLKRIEDKLEDKYVTKESFQPVKNIVYGMVGGSMLTVLGAIMTMVLRQ